MSVDRLRLSLENIGLSQAEAARRLGMSPQNLHALKSGLLKDGTAHWRNLSELLGVDPGWLRTGDGPAPAWFRRVQEPAAVYHAGPDNLFQGKLRAAMAGTWRRFRGVFAWYWSARGDGGRGGVATALPRRTVSGCVAGAGGSG